MDGVDEVDGVEGVDGVDLVDYVDEVEIIRATAAEARRVLRMTLACGRMSSAELEAQVGAFEKFAREAGLDLSRQWAAISGGRIVGGCTWLATPGRTAMILLPQGSSSSCGGEVTQALVARALKEGSKSDISMAQCLIDPADSVGRTALEGAGFFEIGLLIYLERAVTAGAGRSVTRDDTGGAGLTWMTYGPETHATFAELILATYEGSRDCPRLSGLREIEDILAGHMASGRFDPRWWAAACVAGEAVGCILLVENPLRPVMEVAYMGVRPRWRGKGMGRTLLSWGFSRARASGFDRLTLAVDASNEPALRLYQGFGFFESSRRRAMVRVMDSASSASGR